MVRSARRKGESMARRFAGLLVVCLGAAACAHLSPPPPPPVISRYRAPGVDWASVRRVVVMPLDNQSDEPEAADDIRGVLAAELQAMGRFEVIMAAPDCDPIEADPVHVSGRFREPELFAVALRYHADAVLIGSVTQYRPYTPPSVGLSLELVSAAEAVVVASLDGVWDSRDSGTAFLAREFYLHALNPGHSLIDPEKILTSPTLYQKFVCRQAALAIAVP
jgi:hypothetical protein